MSNEDSTFDESYSAYRPSTHSSGNVTMKQTYETVVYDDKSDRAVFFFTVPARSMSYGVSSRPAAYILEKLEVTASRQNLSVSSSDDVEKHVTELLDKWFGKPELLEFSTLDYMIEIEAFNQFAKYLTTEKIVPFECSPVSAVSLAEILQSFETFTGFVATKEHHDLYLIAIGALGIIIFGAARGIAKGLETGLKTRINEWVIGVGRSPTKPVFTRGHKKPTPSADPLSTQTEVRRSKSRKPSPLGPKPPKDDPSDETGSV